MKIPSNVFSYNTQGVCNDSDVRLVDSPEGRDYEGRLEICYDGEWGTVCKFFYDHLDDYDNNIAKVVCKQLGLSLHGEWKLLRTIIKYF